MGGGGPKRFSLIEGGGGEGKRVVNRSMKKRQRLLHNVLYFNTMNNLLHYKVSETNLEFNANITSLPINKRSG